MTKTFTLKIDCENEAFQPDSCYEIARILREISDRMMGDTEGAFSKCKTVLDYNGNDVGRYSIKDL